MKEGLADLWIGPAGWAYDDWSGVVYPRRRPRGFDPLGFLARFVDLMEVNATFYAPLTARTAARWIPRVADAPRFRFVVKAWQEMTHRRELPSAAAMDQWAEVLVPLMEAGLLTAVLVQFPASVRPGRWMEERILRLRDRLPPVPLAVEQRSENAARAESLAFLQRERLAFVNVDQPVLRGQLSPTAIATTDLGYVRLHGRNAEAWFDLSAGRNARYDYRYSGRELAEWVVRVQRLRRVTRATLVVTNNHFEGQAVAAALELAARISGEPVPMPEPLVARFSDLEPWASPEPGSLF